VLPREDAVPSPVEQLVGEFRGYLLVERGMAAGSVLLYSRWFASESMTQIRV
jgi:hypothetical protein